MEHPGHFREREPAAEAVEEPEAEEVEPEPVEEAEPEPVDEPAAEPRAETTVPAFDTPFETSCIFFFASPANFAVDCRACVNAFS